MTQRVLVSALLAVFVAACGGDGKITEPQSPARVRALAAIGTDPVTGATIETDKDDYAPGEVVHLTGRGWAPNETVHLFMAEDPDTHGDVTQDVQADSTGAFSLHFYDVQQHDLGVTFTLTATGATSGSVAAAVFTDGTLNIGTANDPALPPHAGSRVFSPNADPSHDAALLKVDVQGKNDETNILIDIRTGNAPAGTSVRTLGPGVDYDDAGPNLSFTRSWDGKNNSDVAVPDGIYTARVYSNGQPLPSGPSDVTGSRRIQLLVDRTAPVMSAVQLSPSTTTPGTSVTFTATATDALTPITEGAYRIGAGDWLPMAASAPPFNALAEGLTVTFPAPGAGTYSVCARGRDLGLTWSDGTSCATLVVANPNQSPTATANSGDPYAGDEGSDIDLTGSGSDPDGGSVTYAWSVDAPAGVCTFGSLASAVTTVTCKDNGSWTLTLTVTDDESTVATSTAPLTVDNVAPTINAKTAGGNANEGSMIAFSVSNVTDPSSADTDAGFQYAFACDGVNFGAFGSSASTSCAAGDGPGSVTIAAKAKDKNDGVSAVVSSTFTILNLPPTIADLTAPSSVPEGTTITFSVNGITDPSAVDAVGPFTYAFSCGAATPTSFGSSNSGSCPAVDDGPVTVNARVRDKDGGESATFSKVVTVTNVAPAVGLITAPLDPVKVGVSLGVSAAFSDVGTGDTHTALWSWGDGTTSGGTVSEASGSGSATGSHVYGAAGVYTIKLTVTDDDGGSGESIYMYVVVYDPNAGFVTGGGWIDSPSGAYRADPSLRGKANFGFVSKYKKGMAVPEGNTEFQFHAGNLNFKSSAYQWLVVTTFKGIFKGTGTINGVAGYGFLLSAIDGQINGGGGIDKFRIKIWKLADDGSEGDTIYDNQYGAAIDSEPTTTLGGGSIVIHTGK